MGSDNSQSPWQLNIILKHDSEDKWRPPWSNLGATITIHDKEVAN